MNKEDILISFFNGRQKYFRGGGVLKKLLTKESKVLSGEDALLIYNTYGIRTEDLNLLALSHGFEIDEESYAKLLMEQEENMKNSRSF